MPQKPARHGGDCRLVAIGFLSVEAFHLQLSIFSKIVPVSFLAREPPVNHPGATQHVEAAPKLTAWLQAELAPRSGASKTRNTT